jgi:hypothetical protein
MAQRIVRLTALFRALPPADARSLAAALERPQPKDKLAQAFHHRLAAATRAKLLEILEAVAAGR